jgi:hypothetical protein
VSDGSLFSFGIRDGAPLHRPIAGIAGYPATVGPVVLHGTASGEVVARGEAGAILGSLSIGEPAVARIGVDEGRAYVIGESGTVSVIGIEGLIRR